MKTKQFLSVLLALALCLGLLPGAVSATEEEGSAQPASEVVEPLTGETSAGESSETESANGNAGTEDSSGSGTENTNNTIIIDDIEYTQMYVEDNGNYVTVAEGTVGIGNDIWLYSDSNGTTTLNTTTTDSDNKKVYNNYNITCDESIGEVGIGLNGTNWRKGNVKPGAEGYIYAEPVSGTGTKYAIKAIVNVNLELIYDDKGNSKFTVTAGMEQAFTFPPIIYVDGVSKQLTAEDFNTTYTFTCDKTIGTLSWYNGEDFSELAINTTNAVPGTTGKITITNATDSGKVYTCDVTVSETPSSGNEGTSGEDGDTAELMYRYMSRSNGQFYEDTSRNLISVSNLTVSYGESEVVRFYYGNSDGYTPATSVSVTEGSCIAVTTDTTSDGKSTTYWELEGTDLGTATLSVGVGDQTYSATVSVILPDNGFYTSYTDLSKETYLPDGFTYDGTNDTFYLVWNNRHSYIPADSKVSITYWDNDMTGLVSTTVVGTRKTFNNTSAECHAIKFTIANTVSDNFGFEVNFGVINRDGDTETNTWAINITDNSPKLMYRYMSRSNGQVSEDTSRALISVSNLTVSYGESEVVRFYYGNSAGYTPATAVSVSEDSCIAVTTDTTSDGKSTTYWELEGTDLGTATLSVGVGDQTYSAAVPVILPDNGFYTSYTDLSKETYLPDGFTYDETNDTFYLVWNNSRTYIPADSEVSITYWDSNLTDLVSIAVVETGKTFNNTSAKCHAIKFTVADSVSSNFGFDVNFGLINREGDTETNSWGIYVKGISSDDQDGSINGINFRETLISDTRPIEDGDKLSVEETEDIGDKNGPTAFQYDVNGDGKPETYYLCTMSPMYEDQVEFSMSYASGSSKPYDENAHFLTAYCIGIWTYNAGANFYSLVDGDTKDKLLAAFGDSWSVSAYHTAEAWTDEYVATYFPAVYSWTPANGWPCGRAFVHYANCIGDWDYAFTGTINGKTVTAYAHAGFNFFYENLEYTATSVADANAKLQYWAEIKDPDDSAFMGDTTYTLYLLSGEYTGVIHVPEEIDVRINGSTTGERTVLTGGVIGPGLARVSNIDFIGYGWQHTNWPNNDIFNGEPNYGLSTAKGGRYSDCSFKNYYHALHCGFNQKHAPNMIFGGERTLFENNFIALYLNSNQNGGGNLTMYANTFRYNGCALWLESMGNDFPLNHYHLIQCKFYDNGWDVINLLGKYYFLPGQLFERDGVYGHGKFAGRRDALITPPEKDAPEKAFNAAADVSEEGSGVYTFPVAKDDKFEEFDYTNKDAVIGNHNASSWLIPEKDLDGKTITVIQDEKGEDVTIWSFGEEN